MSRRSKRRGGSFAAGLKYEVYGIVILILSVITLAGGPGEQVSGVGSVGRSLANICYFLAGKYYFLIPLFSIYIGLFAMMKRRWPREWSPRKAGVVLFFSALLIHAHIGLFALKEPLGDYTSLDILKQPFQNLTQYLQTGDRPVFKQELGGGMIGAFFFSCFYFLFDLLGTKLIVFSLYAISVLYITGLSYVEMARWLKKRAEKVLVSWKNLLLNAWILLKPKTFRKRQPAETPKALPIPGESETFEVEFAGDTSKRDGKAFSPFMDFSEEERDEFPRYRDFQDSVEDERAGKNARGDILLEEEASWNIAEPDKGEDESELGMDKSEDMSTIKVNIQPKGKSVLSEPELKLHTIPNELYQLPPLDLLKAPSASAKGADQSDYKANAKKLESTLESFGVRAKVLEVVRGPSVTRYEILPDVGVKVSRIVSLTDDIALALAAKDIRMEAPIPGKSAIGIEVPNKDVSIVTLREVMESSAFQEAPSKLSVALGRDIAGNPIIGNLARMPHLLVAGATGSGKSVCVNGMITSILYKAKPDEVKFLMIDPKMVELNVYNGIPHLIAPVVTDPRRANLALKKIVAEMEKRYEQFSKTGTRNIDAYNALLKENPSVGEPLPYIVVIVDELADLMMVAAKDVEDSICRLAQMARAAGIHLIIATQRPSVDVITGLIKANIPSRIAFGVSSQVDSRTILDMAGAEKLLGRGDMLYLPMGASKPLRIQGAFVSDQEVEAVVKFVSHQQKAEYREEMVPEVLDSSDEESELEDELFDQAVQIVLEAKQASVSLLQRRLRIGYTRAARLIDAMEAKGVVGPYEGSKPREVLITPEQYFQNRMSS